MGEGGFGFGDGAGGVGCGVSGQSPLALQCLLQSVLQQPPAEPAGYPPQVALSPHLDQQQEGPVAEKARTTVAAHRPAR